MTTIVTRAGKGSALSWNEVDANFTNLNTAKFELGVAVPSGVARAIPYLSATNVMSLSSGFTFDGTNLGLGGTPGTWFASSRAIQFGGGGASYMSVAQQTTSTCDGYMMWGLRLTGDRVVQYMTTGDAVSAYRQVGAVHTWFNAASGTANTTATLLERMRINASGGVNIGGGTDPGVNNLAVSGAIINALGAAATPSYTFTGDLNTGMYWIAADTLGFATGGIERARFGSAGDMGIGVAPGVRFHVRGVGLDTMRTVARFENGNVAGTDFHYLDVSVDAVGNVVQLASTGTNVGGFTFLTGATERMRIEGGGNVMIGSGTATHGLNVANGATSITGSSSSVSLFLSAALRHTGTTTFFIDGTSGGTAAGITFRDGSGFAQRLVIEAAGNLRPGGDNTLSLGTASFRWSQVFAAIGTINTSDEREKIWRGGIEEAERDAARAIIGELGFYQWTDAVAEKGPKDARMHFGVRAQRVWAIMAEHGLVDPIGSDGRPGKTPYAFLCYDEWDDFYEDIPVQPDEDGNVDPEATPERRLLRAAGSRYGLRLDQMTLFLLAGIMPT